MADKYQSSVPIQVVLEVQDHNSLTTLLDKIGDSGIDAETLDIREGSLSSDVSVQFNLDNLTAKQLETLELALKEGYYKRPRDTDLESLADELEVSKSAVSQRLRSAERNLIIAALQEYV